MGKSKANRNRRAAPATPTPEPATAAHRPENGTWSLAGFAVAASKLWGRVAPYYKALTAAVTAAVAGLLYWLGVWDAVEKRFFPPPDKPPVINARLEQAPAALDFKDCWTAEAPDRCLPNDLFGENGDPRMVREPLRAIETSAEKALPGKGMISRFLLTAPFVEGYLPFKVRLLAEANAAVHISPHYVSVAPAGSPPPRARLQKLQPKEGDQRRLPFEFDSPEAAKGDRLLIHVRMPKADYDALKLRANGKKFELVTVTPGEPKRSEP